jgi:hypothetical protein
MKSWKKRKWDEGSRCPNICFLFCSIIAILLHVFSTFVGTHQSRAFGAIRGKMTPFGDIYEEILPSLF